MSAIILDTSSHLDSGSGDSPTERGFYLDATEIARRKLKMRDDVWLFMQWVCQPQRSGGATTLEGGGGYVERFHRPLAYMLKGDALRLAASLEMYDSEVVRQIREELVRRNIDWRTPLGVKRLRAQLRRVNERISRSMAKTYGGLDVLLHDAVHDPDTDIGIVSKSDPAAWAMCSLVGSIVRSPEFAMYYPERLFPMASGKGYNYDSYVTQEWIQFNGGRRPDHAAIIAKGCNSQWYSWHGKVIYCDDLCSTEAKQGVATVEDALRFIASMSGLSVSERFGGTRELFVGTITGPRDDNSVLVKNDDYLSIRVPIWTKPSPVTVRNMMLDGEPTLPEWYSIEDIQRKRKKELENPQFGKISWLQNFELTAHEAGVMSFTQELLNRAKFQWVTKRARELDPVTRQPKEVLQRWIRRYRFVDSWEELPDGSKVEVRLPKRSADAPQLAPGAVCGCYLRCKSVDALGAPLPPHQYVDYNPAQLPRVLGVDQSFVASGDPWAVACIARDPDGVLYSLRGAHSVGYPKMIAAIPMVCKLYGGDDNFPKKVGIESNAAQSNTAYWMQQSEGVFGLLSRRIVKVSPGGVQKTMRIFNNVYSSMEMGTLMIDPDDTDFEHEALAYDSSASDPVDDILDAVAMGVVIHTQVTGDVEADRKQMASDDADYWKGVDPNTGVDVTTNFMEETWW